MEIDQQKQIAAKVLIKLQAIDPHTILAGGAPSNWFFDKPARDLDFYLHVPPHETYCAFERRLRSLGFEFECISNLHFDTENLVLNTSADYKCLEHLHSVYDISNAGMEVQVMRMNESTFTSVVDKFGTSVCRAWWLGGDIQTTGMFRFSHKVKTIYYENGYSAKEKHIRKMQEKYPTYLTKPISDIMSDLKKYKEEHG